MKKSKQKKLTSKLLSTSATATILFSSVLAPMSVLAENVEANSSTGEIVQNDIEKSSIVEESLELSNSKIDAPFMGQKSFTYSNSNTLSQLQNWAVNSGIYLTIQGNPYPFTTSLRYTNINWEKGGYIGVNYTYTFEGKTYSGYRNISFTNKDFVENNTPDPEENFEIFLTKGDNTTIEYGSDFNPINYFSGYVSKGNLVYESVSSYEGNYKNGVKPGNYVGNMRFKATPSSGQVFNLTTPVTIKVVRTQLDEATKLVNDLFEDNTYSELKDGINQENINTTLDKVNALPQTSEKTELLNLLEKAQELLNTNMPEYRAEESVNNLFGDDEHTILAEGVTQADIDAVKEEVNALTDSDKKEELLNEIQKAQDLLNEKNEQESIEEATTNVNNLFSNDEHTILAEGVTQEDIDAAKELVSALTDSDKKEELLNEVQKAQELLDKKNEQESIEEATTNVNNLFGDDEHTVLADDVTQEDIDTAKDLANKVTDVDKKEELLNEIQKAQDLLNEKNKEEAALEEAQTNVNNLFGDDEHTVLADGVTQEDIDTAKELVNKVTDVNKKEELLNEIQKAQDLLNEMNKLTLNELTAASKYISGTARPNSQLRISINGVAKTIIKADAQGNYEWFVSKLAVNDVVKVEMRNPETNQFDKFVEQRISENGVTEETITLIDLEEGDTKVSGKTTPNGQVRLNIDGVAKNVTTADAQGNYEFVIASGLKAGAEIKVELKSKGTYSISATTTVLARVLTLNPITSADDVIISGKTRNPNQKLRISLNGKAKTIISSKDGVFEYRMGKLTADSVVKVEALEGSTVIESVEQTVKSVSNEERPDVKLDAVMSGTKTMITGKAPAKASLRISLNGKAKTVVTADEEGNFSYMIGKVQSGDKVKIEIRDGGSYVYATELEAK